MPNLTNTSSGIQPRHLPVSRGNEPTEFDVAGFKVQAADLGDIRRATFEMKIPLNPGEYKVPGDFEDIELTVKNGTTANIQLAVNQNAEGKSIITRGEVNLTRELIIKNPASALEPTGNGNGFNGFLDDIKDAAADLKIQKVFMSPNGDIHVVGKIDMPWPIPDERIDRVEATINPDIEKSSIVLPELKELGPLLAKAGAITGRASYDAYIETTPRSLGVEHPSIHLTSNHQPIVINAQGEAEITSNGTILLNLQDSDDPSVHSGPATVSATGFAELNLDMNEGFVGNGELAFRANIHNIRGNIQPTDGLRIPMNFTGNDLLSIRGRTVISLRGDDIRLNNGVFNSNLRDEVNTESALRHSGSTASMGHGALDAQANGRFRLDENGIRIFDTTVAAGIRGSDASFTLDGYRAELAGLIESKLNASDVELSSSDFTISGRGGVYYRIDPRTSDLREDHDLRLFERNINFSLTPDGKLTVKPGEHGAAEFFAPFLRLSGNPDRLVSNASAAVGAVDSAALLKHMETVAEAKTSQGNKVELLIDGAMSYPKRMELIRGAKESLCLQTLIFKDDESGLETARELVAAAQRGVDVRVIVDTLGNVENFDHIVNDRELYQVLRAGGVKLELYNDPRDSGLGELVNAISLVPSLSEIKSPNDLNNPEIALKVVMEMISVANGKVSVEQSVRETVEKALNVFSTTESTENDLIRLPSGRIINAAQAALMAKLIAEMNHRWHEKYLIADGQRAILGGLNIADEYMFGGTGRRFETMGAEREAWRDTDIYIEGPAARDSFNGFSDNWKHIRGESLPEPSNEPVSIEGPDATTMQFIQHHPRIDGDHNITNFMVETIKSLKAGEKAYIANSYFIPTGALSVYKQALMDAAQRGVDVRVVTNSAETTDAPQINQAAVFPYRELLKAGVRIFERKGERTMHSKAAVFGTHISAIGSWNADNRSASLNSECVAVTYSPEFGAKVEKMIIDDMAPEEAYEVTLESIESLPLEEEIENSTISILSDLM